MNQKKPKPTVVWADTKIGVNKKKQHMLSTMTMEISVMSVKQVIVDNT
ncbi:hypothetical protein ACFPCW_16620 [Vibrio thalassae]